MACFPILAQHFLDGLSETKKDISQNGLSTLRFEPLTSGIPRCPVVPVAQRIQHLILCNVHHGNEDSDMSYCVDHTPYETDLHSPVGYTKPRGPRGASRNR